MELDLKHFKGLLETELTTLENELKTVGRKNPDNPQDWEATEPQVGEQADELDVAENLDEYENRRGILNQLEVRLNDVKKALSKIEDGSYGTCEIGGEKIELDRLEANPAAWTCKKHMGK